MYRIGGGILILIGGLGLLTSPTPPGIVRDIGTAFYWGIMVIGGVLVLIGLFRRPKP